MFRYKRRFYFWSALAMILLVVLAATLPLNYHDSFTKCLVVSIFVVLGEFLADTRATIDEMGKVFKVGSLTKNTHYEVLAVGCANTVLIVEVNGSKCDSRFLRVDYTAAFKPGTIFMVTRFTTDDLPDLDKSKFFIEDKYYVIKTVKLPKEVSTTAREVATDIRS